MNKNEIIVRHKNKESNRSIAKELGISKNTVNSYVNDYKNRMKELNEETDAAMIAIIQNEICSKPVKKKTNKMNTAFTKEVEQRFNEIIKIDEERNIIIGNNKQQLTAALLHRTLINEGFKVGETTIRSKYREYKGKNKECFIKQHYEYGDIAQYDFHQVKVILNGEKKIYHQATISIPKSNIIFGMLYENERTESFIDSLVQFFSFCKGVFKTIVFDNMSTAVKRFCFKGEKEYTDDLIKISNYYGFKIETCNPRRGNEKGHVENSGKVIRRDFFCLKYQFDSVEELMLYYEHELSERNHKHATAFKEEQKHLMPLPVHPYELGRLQYAKTNSYSLISIDGNFYSVPDKYVEKKVICNIYTNRIVIYDDKNNLIANHIKKDGKGEYSINIGHYIDTLLKKPKALKNSYALKQAPEILQSIFNKYFITKPKEFLHYLLDTDAFNDDLYELGIEVGVLRKSRYRSTRDFFNRKDYSNIDEASQNQLNYTSNLFGQEV
jgi:transposase